jgi:hypothetical protein
VVGDHHVVDAEVGDAELTPDDRRRRLSVGKCSATHNARENRRGGSCPWSMVAG